MAYKVFLVEDEVVAREGIRDYIDWKSAGFEFCGEAQDGEVALPLIETTQPDVLITDIKMPFMDGLQLCKIVRKHMPWVKIIILSGYDEFSYAQTAVRLGVTEYLLKPVSAQNLRAVLARVAALLDQEKSERKDLKLLKDQVEDNIALLKEKFLLRLVLGGESTLAAIEQSQQFGLDIISKCYLVILFRVEQNDRPESYRLFEKAGQLVSSLAGATENALLAQKDVGEWVLIFKGDDGEQTRQEGAFLAELICQEVEKQHGFRLAFGLGSIQQRLGSLHHSYTEALIDIQAGSLGLNQAELRKLDPHALAHYLEMGAASEYDLFFAESIHPLAEIALRSSAFKSYLVLDIALSAAQFVSDLGGSLDRVIPELHKIEEQIAEIKTIQRLQETIGDVLANALAFRDRQAHSDHAVILYKAKTYIYENFSDPDLSLNHVAGQVGFSPSHFSAVFSRETGETFKDYLIRFRLDQAKVLLNTTRLKCAEIAYHCGYNDPHYFSKIFRKHTGLSPKNFRYTSKVQPEQDVKHES